MTGVSPFRNDRFAARSPPPSRKKNRRVVPGSRAFMWAKAWRPSVHFFGRPLRGGDERPRVIPWSRTRRAVVVQDLDRREKPWCASPLAHRPGRPARGSPIPAKQWFQCELPRRQRESTRGGAIAPSYGVPLANYPVTEAVRDHGSERWIKLHPRSGPIPRAISAPRFELISQSSGAKINRLPRWALQVRRTNDYDFVVHRICSRPQLKHADS